MMSSRRRRLLRLYVLGEYLYTTCRTKQFVAGIAARGAIVAEPRRHSTRAAMERRAQRISTTHGQRPNALPDIGKIATAPHTATSARYRNFR
jgi:hypothetical protein